MGEIRKDYTSERHMIVYKGDYSGAGPDSAYSPGNEYKTNPSILSLVSKDGMLQHLQDGDGQIVKDWSIRVFECNNPIVSTNVHNEYSTIPFYSEPAYGHHFVLVASPNSNDTLATIGVEQWSNILVVVQDRVKWLYKKKGVAYVAVYADHYALDIHNDTPPHLNVVSLKMIPPSIAAEMKSHHDMQNQKGICPTCQTIEMENDGPRQILKTDNFIAYCPWSSSYPLEFWIVSKKHAPSFPKITQREINDLALMLRATLGGLSNTAENISYSIAFHLSAEKKTSRHIHWHIEVYPITKSWSGMERGYGIHLNDISPEDAAKKLGIAARREIVNIVGID